MESVNKENHGKAKAGTSPFSIRQGGIDDRRLVILQGFNLKGPSNH